jgi:hypothetical protein
MLVKLSFNDNLEQLLVSCGGGRRPADGLRKQHVRTIRLLVWDTLEDIFFFLLYTFIEFSIIRYTYIQHIKILVAIGDNNDDIFSVYDAALRDHRSQRSQY